MIVVDASAMVAAVLRTNAAGALTERLLGDDAELHARHLIDIETLGALRRLVRQRALAETDAQLAVRFLADVPICRHPARLLRDRVWDLRDNLGAYAGAYVALAEVLGAPLVTCDTRLARAPGHSAHVECFAE